MSVRRSQRSYSFVSHISYLIVTVGLCFFAASAQAQSMSSEKLQEAREHYENGTRKFDVGRYDEAAEEFQAAYEIVGDPVVLYNIAQSYRLGQIYDKALAFYKSYLRRIPNASNRKEVERRIGELNAIIAEQKLHPPPPPPPPTPDANDNKGGLVTVEGQPKSDVPEPPAPETPAERRARHRKIMKISGAVALAVGGAALASGIAFSVLAAKAASDIEAAARANAEFDQRLRDIESKGKTYDVVGIASYVVSGVFVAGGTALLIAGLKKDREPNPQALHFSPWAGNNQAGLSLSGRF